jgi:hypothetical protein
MWKSISFKTKYGILLAVLFVSASAVAADKAYISVDETGQPQASDRPPATGAVEQVIAMPESPQPDATQAQEEVQRINQKADQMAAERKQKQDQQSATREQGERQQVSCAAARSRLEQLESQPPNRRLVANPDGTARRVSWEEMQELLAAARRQVAQDCGSVDAPAAAPTETSGESPRGSERSKSSTSSERSKSSASSERSKN